MSFIKSPSVAVSSMLPRAVILAATVREVLSASEAASTNAVGAVKSIVILPPAESNNFNKPVVSFIAGQTAPKGKRMGHAGAIISEGSETADAKIKILKECGVSVAKTVSEIGETMLQLIEE